MFKAFSYQWLLARLRDLGPYWACNTSESQITIKKLSEAWTWQPGTPFFEHGELMLIRSPPPSYSLSKGTMGNSIQCFLHSWPLRSQDSTQGSMMLESRNILHTWTVPCDKTQVSSRRLRQWRHLRADVWQLILVVRLTRSGVNSNTTETSWEGLPWSECLKTHRKCGQRFLVTAHRKGHGRNKLLLFALALSSNFIYLVNAAFLCRVNGNWKEAASAETNRLTRTLVLWRDWNVTGPEANYLILG